MASSRGPPTEESWPLGMDKAKDDSLWLMKVPSFLLEQLNSQRLEAGPSRSLGVVQEQPPGSGSAAGPSRDGRGGRTFTLSLSDSVAAAEDLPREYEMQFAEPPEAMYLLSMPPQDGKAAGRPAHEGRISAKGEVKPAKLSAEYKALLRKRGEAASATDKMAVLSDEHTRELKPRLDHLAHTKASTAARESKQLSRDAASNKRARAAPMTRAEMRDAVKAAFSEQGYWRRRDLEQRVGNPKELGACLEQLCVKVTKKGLHYNDYQLKPEFRAAAPAGPS